MTYLELLHAYNVHVFPGNQTLTYVLPGHSTQESTYEYKPTAHCSPHIRHGVSQDRRNSLASPMTSIFSTSKSKWRRGER